MAAMTWGRFKELAEQAGITDEMEIQWIDISYPCDGSDHCLPGFSPADENGPDGITIC